MKILIETNEISDQSWLDPNDYTPDTDLLATDEPIIIFEETTDIYPDMLNNLKK